MNSNKILETIFSNLIKEIKPDNSENTKIKNISNETITFIKNYNETHEKYLITDISPQGSTGLKQTHLKGNSDIDIFIFLDPNLYINHFLECLKGSSILEKFKDKNINNKDNHNINQNTHIKVIKNNDKFLLYRKNKIGIEKLFKNLCVNWIIPSLKIHNYRNITLSYAEHPYVSAEFKGFDIDIIFAFLLDEDYIKEFGPITAVDRTYYHTMFVKKYLDDKQKDYVRILKLFFKSNYSYGDKASTGRGGFIGYSLEILIYYFKDIYNLINNF